MDNHRKFMRKYRKSLGIKTTNPKKHGILRAIIWSKKLITFHSCDPYKFELSYFSDGEKPTGRFEDYVKGKTSAQYESMKEVERNPDIKKAFVRLFELPIFELLANKNLGKTQIERILEPYIERNKSTKYRNIYDRLNFHDYDIIARRFVYSREVYEFTQLLGWLRMAECKNDSEWHMKLLGKIYTIFPWIAIDKLFKKEYLRLYRCIRDLHNRMYTSNRFIAPNIEGIRNGINRCIRYRERKSNSQLIIFPPAPLNCYHQASLRRARKNYTRLQESNIDN